LDGAEIAVSVEAWYIVIGLLLVAMTLIGSIVKRLPLTTPMLYLAVGLVLGPLGFDAIVIDPLTASALMERLAEIAVIVSLFTTGLKLRVPLRDKRWRIPVLLAFSSMALTVGLIAAVGVLALGLPLGAAVLLGAILAPTDPVLASDVQLEDAYDPDRLRFSITAEAGLNDGTAFPFVMLGLGLLGLHELGPWGSRWLVLDVLWAIGAGLGIGAVLGMLVARVVIYLRREHKEGVGRDEFLALGLIALSYGVAVKAHAYGFLAVFAAGLALRTVELRYTGEKPPADVLAVEAAGKAEEIATHPKKAPAHMARAVLTFNEQIERVLELALVLVVAAMLSAAYLRMAQLWFIPLLLLLIRPLAVNLGLVGCPAGYTQRMLISWFGIRGIGSIYYLMYAIEHGLPADIASHLIAMTLSVIAASVLVHGISVTPLMAWYEAKARGRRT
jgi:NhaP-type Na+/H+ or K+/H+ antiporter